MKDMLRGYDQLTITVELNKLHKQKRQLNEQVSGSPFLHIYGTRTGSISVVGVTMV